MTLRTSGALVAFFLVAAAGACATGAATDTGSSGGGGDDAGVASDQGAGPSPDAIVLGVDTGGGGVDDDATSDPDAGGGSPDAPEEFVQTGKSCVGLPDGTPCGPSPDVCHDVAACAGGVCAAPQAKADGFVCGTAPDICHDAPACESGACAPQPKADGTVCANAPDGCHTDGTCKSGSCGAVGTRADGYEWTSGDDTARCCGGKPIHTTSDTDCGACGIKCNASNGESCSALAGRYFCRGCVASSACWSHCCSESFSPYTCAASDCAGDCDSTYCPTGTHCVSGAPNSSDYCAY
ncbi:MAG TPA: hypothetical protein VIY73_10005 [Polyangiaceae bacterium]